MLKIISTILLILSLLISCSNLKQPQINNNIIAHNESYSIKLNESEFEIWMLQKQQLILNTKKEQIHAYFIEQLLFQQRSQINLNQLNRIAFLNDLSMYNNSINHTKLKLWENVQIDSTEVDENVNRLLKKNKLKKHKVRLYQIYKEYPLNASDDVKQKIAQDMLSIRMQVSNLQSFMSLAETESDSQTRLKKGLIGNVKTGTFTGEINNIIMDMKANELSEIIIGTKGILLFYCEKIIPPKIKSSIEIITYVENILSTNNFKKLYQQKKDLILANSNIQIDFNKLKKYNNKLVAVNSTDINLTLEQVSWLLNGHKGAKILNDFSQQKISNVINEYIIKRSFFNDLPLSRQLTLKTEAKHKYREFIAITVMTQMISHQLKIPSLDETKKYFLNNKDSFIREKHYDISAIAFKFTNKTKITTYNKAQQILSQLNNNLISFNQASEDFSFLDSKYKHGYLGKFSRNQLPGSFGINVLKQVLLMQAGQLSKLVETESGIFWIIKLNTIDSPRLMSFKEAKHQAHNQLGGQRTSDLENKIMQNLIQNNIITIIR